MTNEEIEQERYKLKNSIIGIWKSDDYLHKDNKKYKISFIIDNSFGVTDKLVSVQASMQSSEDLSITQENINFLWINRFLVTVSQNFYALLVAYDNDAKVMGFYKTKNGIGDHEITDDNLEIKFYKIG